MALDGITIKNLTSELKETLLGGQIQKIYQPDSNTIVFVIRNQYKEHSLIYSEKLPFAHLRISNTELIGTSETPPAFCMLLRKHLLGSRIGNISQEGWDRIIRISFDHHSGTKISTKQLIIELTGRLTNLLVIDENEIIFDALHRVNEQQNSYRTLQPHEKYRLPPSQPRALPIDFDIIRMANSLLSQEQDSTIAKVIQKRFEGLGPTLTKEILFLSGLNDSSHASEMSLDSWKNILSTLKSKVEEILSRSSPVVYFLKPNSKSSSISPLPLSHLDNSTTQIKTITINEALNALTELLGSQNSGKKAHWGQLVGKELQRLLKRSMALKNDYAKWNEAPPYQLWGDLLMIHLHETECWLSEITYPNIFNADGDAPPEEITIFLNKDKTPLENAQNFYQLQKKSIRALEKIQIQQEAILKDHEYFVALQHHLHDANSADELQAIQAELIFSGLLKENKKNKSKNSTNQPYLNYLKFTSPSGYPILVGKNNYQNDQITFKEAKPHSIWFHAQKIPGSHVVLLVPQDIDLSSIEDDILMASELAAYHSKGRAQTRLPIDYTLRKNVWKPKGAHPGFVLYEKQKTAYVTPKLKEACQ
jgi:Predicted RNA-binding protein homologous to eukaryotic snRNP